MKTYHFMHVFFTFLWLNIQDVGTTVAIWDMYDTYEVLKQVDVGGEYMHN